MCEITQQIWDKASEAGREEGREEGKIELIISLVKNGILSVSEAAKGSSIEESVIMKNLEKYS